MRRPLPSPRRKRLDQRYCRLTFGGARGEDWGASAADNCEEFRVKLFIDSAMIDEIQHALEQWDVDGITTNPRHIQASGLPFSRVVREIAALVEGSKKPVSVEVNPHLTRTDEIVEQGLEISRVSPSFVVKVGASESGFAAMRQLEMRGVRVNATLVFTTAQAWHAARAGASFISPFVGWKEQYGDSARESLAEIRAMLDCHGFQSQIIAAAMRNARQLGEAAVAGAHCATASASLIRESFQNPYTTYGEKVFSDAWDKTPQ